MFFFTHSYLAFESVHQLGKGYFVQSRWKIGRRVFHSFSILSGRCCHIDPPRILKKVPRKVIRVLSAARKYDNIWPVCFSARSDFLGTNWSKNSSWPLPSPAPANWEGTRSRWPESLLSIRRTGPARASRPLSARPDFPFGASGRLDPRRRSRSSRRSSIKRPTKMPKKCTDQNINNERWLGTKDVQLWMQLDCGACLIYVEPTV